MYRQRKFVCDFRFFFALHIIIDFMSPPCLPLLISAFRVKRTEHTEQRYLIGRWVVGVSVLFQKYCKISLCQKYHIKYFITFQK